MEGLTKIKKAIDDYVGNPVEIVETRQDPILGYSMAVRTKDHECFIVTKTSREYEVYEEFVLEEGQTLQDLESGEKGLIQSMFS